MATFNDWSNTVTAAGSITLSTTNGAITMNSGTGTISIGTDATAATYNIATGAGAKVVTLGTTNTTSSLALKYGTADFTVASATGTVMSALDTGEITYGLQPAFLATHTADQLNITGNNTAATLNYTTEIFDQNADYDGTNTFTAPVTGRYYFSASVEMSSVALGTDSRIMLVTSNRTMWFDTKSATVCVSSTGGIGYSGTVLCDMDAADTTVAQIVINGIGADTADALNNANTTCFSGYLSC